MYYMNVKKDPDLRISVRSESSFSILFNVLSESFRQPQKQMQEKFREYILTYQRRNTKVGQHHDTKHNPIISEKLEIMLADISHQELD